MNASRLHKPQSAPLLTHVEPYIFVTLVSGKSDTLPPPTVLRSTWMAHILDAKYVQLPTICKGGGG